MIIAFAGKKGCGKTHYAKHRVSITENSRLLSFASLLREECQMYTIADVFNSTKDAAICQLLYNVDGQDLLFRHPEITTNRQFMIHISEQMKLHNPDHYSDEVYRMISEESTDTEFVIDDLRYPSEFDALVRTGRTVQIMFIGETQTTPGSHSSEDVATLLKHIQSCDNPNVRLCYLMGM